jgi:hypothetical protein
MKSRRLAIALFVPFVLACMVGAAALWHHSRLYYATPETESAFLRSYTPKRVIDRFRESNSFSHTRSFGGGAGRTSVGHQAGFEYHIVLRRENWMSLMNVLRDDALQQLEDDGAEVVSQSGSPRNGFRFEYKINQSIGSLTIVPLAINSDVRRNRSLPEGLEDVTVKIEQTEQWYPAGTGMIRVSSTNPFLDKKIGDTAKYP